MLNQGLVTVSYVAATILFILSLGGLSNPETARRGNLYGMVGMAIAIVATVLSDSVHGYIALLACMAVGGSIGAFAAIKVKMTEMPELVAMLHSFVAWPPCWWLRQLCGPQCPHGGGGANHP